MKIIGAHLPISKGIHTIQEQMEMLGCNTCALFLKNQRRYDSKPLDDETIKKFKSTVKDPTILLPHGPYLVNLANPEKVEKSYECFIDDVRRCHDLGILLYNIHPGSDTKGIGKKALELVSIQLNRAMKDVPSVIILLENMAGQGSVCGRTFEELAYIIERVEDKERIGVTLDTSHLFSAGYDIRTAENFEKIMKEFDRIVGLKYLRAMHLNDSKCELDSRKDRHEQIGRGTIGIEAFRYIMNSSYFEDIPMILETPNPLEFGKEIALLRSLVNEIN